MHSRPMYDMRRHLPTYRILDSGVSSGKAKDKFLFPYLVRIICTSTLPYILFFFFFCCFLHMRLFFRDNQPIIAFTGSYQCWIANDNRVGCDIDKRKIKSIRLRYSRYVFFFLLSMGVQSTGMPGEGEREGGREGNNIWRQ